jgi:hypothetical protein
VVVNAKANLKRGECPEGANVVNAKANVKRET